MAFQTSPGINVSEVDLTNATPAVGTTEGAIAGVFRWGPTNERVLISSEQQLVARFGEPVTKYTDASYSVPWTNHETFMSAANFLSYSDALFVTRVTENAVKASSAPFTAKYEGLLGNSVEVSYCLSNGFDSVSLGDSTITVASGSNSFQVRGLTTVAQAASIKKGDTLTVNGQFLTVEDSSVTDSDADLDNVVTTTKAFDSDNGATNLLLDAASTGVTLPLATDASTLYSTNYIQLGGSIPSLRRGDPLTYSTLSQSGVIGGLEEGKTYFAVPLVVNKVSFTNSELDADAATDDFITVASHGLSDGDYVQYVKESGADVTNLTSGDYYYVVGSTAAAFKLSLTLGGDAIDLPDTNDVSAFTASVTHVGDVVALDTVTTSHVIRLAATHNDAVASTPTVVTLTSLTTAGASQSQLVHTSAFVVSGTFASKYTGISSVSGGSYTKQWGGSQSFDSAPLANRIHILVKDADGSLTGTAGQVIESFENVSLDQGGKKPDGSSNFISDVLEASSNWISILDADVITYLTGSVPSNNSSLTLGATTLGDDGEDESSIAIGQLAAGYDLYADASDVDVSLILQGKSRGVTLSNYIINNIAEVRRDCIAFISPERSDENVTSILEFANSISATSFAVVDSGYKYQYDKYSDVYRWVPLNGDIAGLCARTDDLRDPWFSPAGYNRGSVKNVVKLLVNPNKAERDLLYRAKVNPVITQPGQGTVLFGDKTFAAIDSAFDRINVRRLFIVLEKTIGQAAKSTLFEFNDEFTRATFVNLVEPFLRDVQGRRGIYDFKVICDESNNTGQVIDTNQFVGDIYIKPARSINYIQLNFVAVRSGVEFSEIVGAA